MTSDYTSSTIYVIFETKWDMSDESEWCSYQVESFSLFSKGKAKELYKKLHNPVEAVRAMIYVWGEVIS